MIIYRLFCAKKLNKYFILLLHNHLFCTSLIITLTRASVLAKKRREMLKFLCEDANARAAHLSGSTQEIRVHLGARCPITSNEGGVMIHYTERLISCLSIIRQLNAKWEKGEEISKQRTSGIEVLSKKWRALANRLKVKAKCKYLVSLTHARLIKSRICVLTSVLHFAYSPTFSSQ